MQAADVFLRPAIFSGVFATRRCLAVHLHNYPTPPARRARARTWHSHARRDQPNTYERDGGEHLRSNVTLDNFFAPTRHSGIHPHAANKDASEGSVNVSARHAVVLRHGIYEREDGWMDVCGQPRSTFVYFALSESDLTCETAPASCKGKLTSGLASAGARE